MGPRGTVNRCSLLRDRHDDPSLRSLAHDCITRGSAASSPSQEQSDR